MSHLKLLPARCRLASVVPDYPRMVLAVAACTALAACAGEVTDAATEDSLGAVPDAATENAVPDVATEDAVPDVATEDSWHIADGLPLEVAFVEDGVPADNTYVPDMALDDWPVAFPIDIGYVPDAEDQDKGTD